MLHLHVDGSTAAYWEQDGGRNESEDRRDGCANVQKKNEGTAREESRTLAEINVRGISGKRGRGKDEGWI